MEKCGYRSVIAYSAPGDFCSIDVNLTMRGNPIPQQSFYDGRTVGYGSRAVKLSLSSRKIDLPRYRLHVRCLKRDHVY